MEVLRVVLLGGGMFFLISSVLVPLGAVVLRGRGESVLCCFGISSGVYAVIVGLAVGLGLPGGVVQVLLLGLAVMSMYFFLSGVGEIEISGGFGAGCLYFLLYYLFCLVSVALPSGRVEDFSPATVAALSDFPIDNLLPYNFSRYLLEGVSFSELEIVPTWSALDRGPIAGLLAACFSLLLGVSDGSHWLSAAPENYFVFQSLMTYLNILPLFAAWLIAGKIWGKSSQVLLLAFLATSYFAFLNVSYTWPKFLMTYFLLAGLYLIYFKNRLLMGATFISLAVLTHQIAWFAVPLVVVFEFLNWLRTRGANIHLRLKAIVAFLLVLSPWYLVKQFSPSPPQRMLRLHLFCDMESELVDLSLFAAVARFVEEQGITGVITTRLGNLFYPFDLTHGGASWLMHWANPVQLFSSLSHLVAYQYIFALGLPAFLLFIMHFFYRDKNNEKSKALPQFIATSFGMLLPAVILFACPQSTINHHWAYPAFIVGAMLAATTASRGGLLVSTLFSLAIASNAFYFVLRYYFQGKVAALMQMSQSILVSQIVLILSMVSVLVYSLISDAPGKSAERSL
ncbi:hypothetical protein BVY02_01770 [bacterium J17]|nr:hypothetical protein BVY02_01770 [bacterium J17]